MSAWKAQACIKLPTGRESCARRAQSLDNRGQNIGRMVPRDFKIAGPPLSAYSPQVHLRPIATHAVLVALAFVLFATPGCATRHAASTQDAATAAAAACAENLAPLIDPANLATLGKRGANPRIQKAVYWLSTAASNGAATAQVIDTALKEVGLRGEAAVLTKQALLRNLDIATRLGCLDKEGLEEMRRGRSPTVRRGPYAGDQLSVDHIIPRSVCPELDNVIANLELMPLRLNAGKGAKVGARQLDLARKLHRAGLLSAQGLRAVEAVGPTAHLLAPLCLGKVPVVSCGVFKREGIRHRWAWPNASGVTCDAWLVTGGWELWGCGGSAAKTPHAFVVVELSPEKTI